MSESAYKLLDENDVVTTRTLLHEAVPITGVIVSGTYGVANIKNYSHGMFQSVYDYPYLSSSANHIYDITLGIGANSSFYSGVTSQKKKKKNVYSQLAQVLAGYDVTGNILQFDQDGDYTGGSKYDEGYFITLSRLLVKDEIKKESFEMTLGVNATYASPFDSTVKIVDLDATNEYRVNSPAGEYGILYATGSALHSTKVNASGYAACGLIYYQAGAVLLSTTLFEDSGSGGLLQTNVYMDSSNNLLPTLAKTIEISGAADALRHRIQNLQFNNTTELNSTIYFCRMNHNEFNYSSNPTYVTGSKIITKNQSTDMPVAYATTIGLYNSRRELMALAKLSEPLKKTPNNEYTLRVRLDY